MDKSQYQEKTFIASAEKELKKNGIEPDLIDLFSLYDKTLTASENKTNLKGIISELTPSFSVDKQQVQAQQEEYIQTLIESKEYIYNGSEELYKDIYLSIEKLIKGYSALLLIKGTAGTGKSYHIYNALKEEQYGLYHSQGYDRSLSSPTVI